MPANYNGNTTGLSGRPTVTISEPVDTDVRNAASVQTPFRKLADFLQYLMTNAAMKVMDAALSMGGFKITNLGAGSAATDAASLGDVTGSRADVTMNAGGSWVTDSDGANPSNKLRLTKIGNTVFLRGYMRRTAGADVHPFDVPAGFRPYGNGITNGTAVFTAYIGGSWTGNIVVTVVDTGFAQIQSGAFANGDYLYVDAQWCTVY